MRRKTTWAEIVWSLEYLEGKKLEDFWMSLIILLDYGNKYSGFV